MDSRVMCPHPKIGPARPKTVVFDQPDSDSAVSHGAALSGANLEPRASSEGSHSGHKLPV